MNLTKQQLIDALAHFYKEARENTDDTYLQNTDEENAVLLVDAIIDYSRN